MTINEFMNIYHDRDKWEKSEREDRCERLWRDVGYSARDAADSFSYTIDAIAKLSEQCKKDLERKEDRMIYHVRFEGTDKLYAYYCAPDVKLQVGSSYMIEADHSTTYKNAITVVKIDNNKPTGVHIRTITHARLINGTKRPDDKIKQVIFNKEKRTTVVLWFDGQKTIIKQQDGDVWDEEKALALCYMKRVLGNRGSFNETLKRYCNQEAINDKTDSKS